MKDKPLVSIIIDNYNYGRFLHEAIDSALSQTYPYTEVIVVDDGSTDNSREIILSYGNRITPVLKENGGQASAFNAGFAVSQGEIIIFLDADDYLFPYAVERIVAAWNPGVAKVHYRLEVVDTTGKPRGFCYPTSEVSLASGEVWRKLFERGNYETSPASGNAPSRVALAQILPIPEAKFRLTADDYLSTLVPFHGQVVSIEEALGAYRIHNNNAWALATVDSDRFRTFVEHDIERHVLLVHKATELGYKLPQDLFLRDLGHLWARIASLRLEPQKHPISSDRLLSLIYWGVRATWKYSESTWKKRIVFSMWFMWVGILPLPVAKPAITWLYAPQFRPRAIDWVLNRIRSLVN